MTDTMKAERQGMKAALDVIQEQRHRLEMEGLSQHSFALGVMNLVVTVFVFASFPEYLWILYTIKCFVFIPAWFFKMIQVYNGALFLLDFCWVANICSGFYFTLLLFNIVPESMRRGAFITFYACGLGPLSWACLLLGNGFVFHSIEKISSLFIHITPSLVLWTVTFHNDKLTETWPGRFPTTLEMNTWGKREIFYHGVQFYAVWLLLHSVWLLTHGVTCPQRGLATVFDDLFRKHKLDKVFGKYTGFKSYRAHAATYLFLHGVLATLSFLWPAVCFLTWPLHTAWVGVLLLSAIWSGAGYYDFILSKKYTKSIVKMLDAQKQK